MRIETFDRERSWIFLLNWNNEGIVVKYLGKTAVMTLAAVTLSACAGMGLQKAEMMAPGGSAFEKGLYQGYVDLSRGEFQEGDYMDSDVFAARAMAASEGNAPGPEEIGARKLPGDKVGILTSARERLMAAFDDGGAVKAPEHAARAQVMFDCWMQEQEENFQPADIEACRAAFFDALGKLEAALEPKMEKKMEPKMEKKAEAPRAPDPMIVDGIYIIFFEFDSAALDSDAMAVVRQVIADYGKAKPGHISIAAHTDTSGSEKYNMALSEKRAASVIEALSNGGVPSGAMTSEAFSEMKPMVPTGDGKRERRNRRVEIIFE